jgi:hypothetical protein
VGQKEKEISYDGFNRKRPVVFICTILLPRQALTPFLPKPEAEAETTAGLKPEPASKAKPKPESKLALESKAKVKPGGGSEPGAPMKPTAEATDKS